MLCSKVTQRTERLHSTQGHEKNTKTKISHFFRVSKSVHHHIFIPEAATAIDKLLMMGMRMPETR
jgi:hypothetical protein